MTTKPQPRQPAGVPEGGQWAAGIRSESHILLTDENLPVWPKQPVTEQDIQRAESALQDIRRVLAKSDDEMLEARRHDICRRYLEGLDDFHKVKFRSARHSRTKSLPRYALWSPGALDILASDSVTGLHDEHMVPVQAQLKYIAERDRQKRPMDGAELAHMVASLPRAVVTDDEAKWVDRIGGRDTMPQPHRFADSPTEMLARYTDPRWNMPYKPRRNDAKGAELEGLIPRDQCSFSEVSELRGHQIERCERQHSSTPDADCVLLRDHRGACQLVGRNRSEGWLNMGPGGARSADEWDALADHLSTPARIV